MTKSISILLFLLILANNVLPQDYLWPTDASRFLTSSFAEYRPGHFHAGIDIKTWGREGYYVYAVRDGYIQRISVSPFGYGKVLYQKLDTGELVVYAHLQRFNARLEQIVRQAQKAEGEYRINKYFAPQEIAVKQGEIIAYTGSTGVGLPHLHFEIRDLQNRPTNPFLLGYEILDTIAPTISNLCVTPLNADARVNGDVKPVIVQPQRFSPGEYILQQELLLQGDIGFAIDCYDQADGSGNRFAVYRADFFVDDVLLFSATYNKFSYEEQQYIDLDRDYRLNRRGLGLFQKLYKEKTNILSFYQPIDETAGIIRCQISEQATIANDKAYLAGSHDFRVELYDFNDNLTTLLGKFIVGRKKQIYAKIETAESGHYYLADIFDEDGNTISQHQAYLSSDRGASWRPIRLASAADPNVMSNSLKHLPGNGNSICILKLIVANHSDTKTFPYFCPLIRDIPSPAPEANFQIEKDFYDDYVRLELKINGFIKTPPRVFIQQVGHKRTEIALTPLEYDRYFGVYQLLAGGDGATNIEVLAQDLAGKELTFWDQFEIKTISPQLGGSLSSKDGNCRLSFGTSAVYKNMFCRLQEVPILDTNKYAFVGCAYDLQPQDVPLKEGAMVSLKFPATESQPTKLGVYGSYDLKNWNFIDNKIDYDRQTISSRLASLRFVNLIKDTIPPEIIIYSPQQKAFLRNKYPLIKAYIRDRLSGIASERLMEIKLDGQKVIAEYDPEQHVVFYKIEEPLEIGEHTLIIRAFDNCGNQKAITQTFTVITPSR